MQIYDLKLIFCLITIFFHQWLHTFSISEPLASFSFVFMSWEEENPAQDLCFRKAFACSRRLWLRLCAMAVSVFTSLSAWGEHPFQFSASNLGLNQAHKSTQLSGDPALATTSPSGAVFVFETYSWIKAWEMPSQCGTVSIKPRPKYKVRIMCLNYYVHMTILNFNKIIRNYNFWQTESSSS